jgi:hypothetical protein
MRRNIAWLAPTPTFTRATVGVGGGENAQLAAAKLYFVFFRDKIYQNLDVKKVLDPEFCNRKPCTGICLKTNAVTKH